MKIGWIGILVKIGWIGILVKIGWIDICKDWTDWDLSNNIGRRVGIT